MPQTHLISLSALMLTALFSWLPINADATPAPKPKKTEAELISMLRSTDHQKAIDALDRLPNWYPKSTTAVLEIRQLLGRTVNQRGVPKNILSRKAARALGNYGATLSEDDLKVFVGFIRSSDIDDVMDGLKALRGLKQSPDSERKLCAEIVLLLQDKEIHVVRDAIRTLGILGNKDIIPALEPFLKYMRLDVKRDAKEAIAAIQKKEAK